MGNAGAWRSFWPARAVHPHARGERSPCGIVYESILGSSPRTWGTRALRGPARLHRRFIPTHVGNARSPGPAPGPTSVHPHARGERATRKTQGEERDGSSPRTWGTPPACRAGNSPHRFIPTHVGNACAKYGREIVITVHPHARGERGRNSWNRSWTFGSSPRTWGTRKWGLGAQAVGRFIPTHVGNAYNPPVHFRPVPVHPHARGERGGEQVPRPPNPRFIPTHVGNAPEGKSGCVVESGSSPRTWGTQPNYRSELCEIRFIPTHVGNAGLCNQGSRRHPVHPHARGERGNTAQVAKVHYGSSPRTWGTHVLGVVRLRERRFIPTHVGNACRRRPSSSCRSVHPHARGERILCDRLTSFRIGSSPRTWGTLGIIAMTAGLVRFIPTHVGNAPHFSRKPGI